MRGPFHVKRSRRRVLAVLDATAERDEIGRTSAPRPRRRPTRGHSLTRRRRADAPTDPPDRGGRAAAVRSAFATVRRPQRHDGSGRSMSPTVSRCKRSAGPFHVKRSRLLAALEARLAAHDADLAAAQPLATPARPARGARGRRRRCTIPRSALDVHVADSLSGLAGPSARVRGLIADLGAGGGLPGLVLAAALPGRARGAGRVGQAQVRVHPRRGRGDGARRTWRLRACARRSGRTARARATSSPPGRSRPLPVDLRVRRAAAARRRLRGRVEGRGRRGRSSRRRCRRDAARPRGGAAAARSVRSPDPSAARSWSRARSRPRRATYPRRAGNCNETPAVCEKPALKARQYRFSRRDPPSAPLASGTE